MNFGEAIQALKAGNKVARSGWNGKGMFVLLVPSSVNIRLGAGTPYGKAIGADVETTINAHIDMKTATGEFQPGWLASQTDILAEDWEIV